MPKITKLSDLVGLEIANVRVKERYGDKSLFLNLADGKTCVILTPVGDCCAHCFINHIDFTDVLQGAKVTEVENLEFKNLQDKGCDVVDSWGHRIHTTKGICTIDMRLEHNGYYGGSLEVEQADGWSDAPLLEDF